ncbi:MAG: hypothetical protein OEV94_04840 [Deltaproteobacteria bacterium]|nr:hypothetical protein [Deltaproteobacteria bacterium]
MGPFLDGCWVWGGGECAVLQNPLKTLLLSAGVIHHNPSALSKQKKQKRIDPAMSLDLVDQTRRFFFLKSNEWKCFHLSPQPGATMNHDVAHMFHYLLITLNVANQGLPKRAFFNEGS